MPPKKVSPDYEARLMVLESKIHDHGSILERHERALSKISADRERRIVELRKELEESFDKKFEGRDRWSRWYIQIMITALLSLLVIVLTLALT